MTDTVIDRFKTRYRLPADPAASMDRRAAIEAPLRTMIDEHLDAALARLALGDEIVLIRSLRTEIRLGRGLTTWQAGMGWSEAIVAAVEQRLREPDPDQVLRFRRRLDALAAFVDCVLEDRFDRDWAWRQMEFLPPADQPASASARRAALPDALVAPPDQLPPLLRLLARRDRIAGLAVVLEDGAVEALAWSAAQALGLAPSIGALADEAIAGARRAAPPWARATVGGRSFLEALRIAPAEDRPAWARLAVLTLEPHRLLAGQTQLDDLAARWLVLADAAGSETETGGAPGASGEASAVSPSRRPPAENALSPSRNPPPVSRLRPPPFEVRSARGERANIAATTGPAANPRPWTKVRAPHRTRFGGLMLLAPAVAESQAGASLFEVDDDQRLQARLHALAMTLAAEAEPDDPAVLVFAGLDPGAAPPPADPVDRDEVEAAAQTVADWLAQRLPDWPPAQRVARLVERTATILAEPGWIEVEFSLADVDPDIRRAGLDLDPGYLPWLGLVLKYRYV